MKTVINNVPNGPKAVGPYSLGVISEGRFLFVAGQGPFDSKIGKYARGSIAEQTERSLSNIKTIVEAAGGRLEDTVSCRIFLQPLDRQVFEQMNGVYTKFFKENPPSRATIGCQILGCDVEIECIVAMDKAKVRNKRTTITQIPNGPKAIGPYSLGVVAEGKFLFVSAQGPFDPKVGGFVRGTLEEQTERTLNNIKTIVEAGGGKLENAVSCRIFLQPLDSYTFERMNSVYTKFFKEDPPARATIGCQLLNRDVGIECVVVL